MMPTSATGALVIQVLAPVRRKAARHFLGARHHRARIGAVIGLGQAEAAEQFAGRHLRQIFAALRLGAIGIDRLHGERGLHRHRRAEAGIDPLELARDQPVADIAETGAAVFLGDGRAQQPERAHLAKNRRVGLAVAIGGDDARKQLLLGIVARGVAHHALFLGQLAFEVERIVPFERGVLDLGAFRLAFSRLLRNLGHRASPRVTAKSSLEASSQAASRSQESIYL